MSKTVHTVGSDFSFLDQQQSELLERCRTVWTDSDLTKKRKLLRLQGEHLFRLIDKEMNQLEPGRARTEEEFEQVCFGLALFMHYLIADSTGG
jgi:hypothetical protein